MEGNKMHAYLRFWAMIITSSITMFGLMYINTYQLSHVWFSQTRWFMTMIMAGAMTIIMFLFMKSMYKNKMANIGILVIGFLLIITGTVLVRSQATVNDVAWMKAMIPHHSIAVLTSTRAEIKDARVRKLADGIIKTQLKEITEMEKLIKDLESEPTK